MRESPARCGRLGRSARALLCLALAKHKWDASRFKQCTYLSYILLSLASTLVIYLSPKAGRSVMCNSPSPWLKMWTQLLLSSSDARQVSVTAVKPTYTSMVLLLVQVPCWSAKVWESLSIVLPATSVTSDFFWDHASCYRNIAATGTLLWFTETSHLEVLVTFRLFWSCTLVSLFTSAFGCNRQ